MGLLFGFKYVAFFTRGVNSVLGTLDVSHSFPVLHVLLPVGISFYTFQILGYSIDVSRGTKEAERHLGRFAVYVAFFPQLVAGPIERSTTLLPQLRKRVEFQPGRLYEGLELVLLGLFKKIVVADTLAIYVDAVYNNSVYHNGASLILATVFFAIQIYCDFSGYSDIARGSARVLGIDLVMNFKNPYFSKTVTEFWRRWHVSLSAWIMDYVYTPIALNRRDWGTWGVMYAVIVTFALVGLWHGANWNYVVFGLLHGMILCVELATRKTRKRVERSVPNAVFTMLCVCYTFSFWCLSLVFFRARSTSEALFIIQKMITVDTFDFFFDSILYPSFLVVGLFCVMDYLDNKNAFWEKIGTFPPAIRWVVSIVFIFSITTLGVNQGVQFIYFQF
ncbi:MAG: MBOAT family O-acyltransferase [Thermodesulfobacteriota bacterium]|nr:MBOAT family O-acyltransferase [Thermodesulfobacteriota bacterium]